jgi:hypothetical protein
MLPLNLTFYLIPAKDFKFAKCSLKLYFLKYHIDHY